MATRGIWSSVLSTKLQSLPTHSRAGQHRSLFYWITIIFNSVNHERVKEVGPDRACAEWLLRNGASIKWKEDKTFLSDYNALPSIKKPIQYIQAVDATNSAISHIGFPHFEGCKYIDDVKLVNCAYIENPALSLLSILKETLNHLEISKCDNISDKALLDLDKLTNLKTLKLENLLNVADKSNVKNTLTKALPNCDITFN